MTAWGFQALNNAGQVLVSSHTRNLHFVGKAALTTIASQFDGYGGLRQFQFTINCNVTPMPFFSMPTNDFYAVSAVRQTSVGVWLIEVIRSGTSATVPEVYVFSDPRGITRRDTEYGMLVMCDDGTPSFDSRLSPLVVTGGMQVQPPSNPLVAGPSWLTGKYCGGDGSTTMGSDNSNTYNFTAPGAKPIFFYPSIAQAEREFQFHESEQDCTGGTYNGNCVGWGTKYDWNSYYWAFYRGGIQYSTGYLRCGWITAQFGCHWTEDGDGSLFGIGTGGSSGASGQWPYSNQTLNLTPTAIITADGSRYDA